MRRNFRKRWRARDALIQLILTGRTPVHEDIQRGNNVEELSEQIQSDFEGRAPAVWVDLRVQTEGTYDVEVLKQGNDFIADLLTLYEKLENRDEFDEFREALKPVFNNWSGKKYLESCSPQDIREILLNARNLTLDQLLK